MAIIPNTTDIIFEEFIVILIFFQLAGNGLVYGKCGFEREDFPKENQTQAKMHLPLIWH